MRKKSLFLFSCFLSISLLVSFVFGTKLNAEENINTELWFAKYYGNTNFEGQPVETSHENLDFNWGSGSPNSEIPSNYFSAVFEKSMDFEGGEYHLVGEVDDQLRVFIDNKLVYEITGGGHRKVQKTLNISSGVHDVRVEYVELTGGASLSLDLLKSEGWLVQYFDNTNLKGIPLFESTSKNLTYNWGGGSPNKSISSDNFSAVFEKNMSFEGGEYHLVGEVDDQLRVFIDNKLVYEITGGGHRKVHHSLNISKGVHNVRVEYVELTGGAKLSLDFLKSEGWLVQYFDNKNFKGIPLFETTSKKLSYNWGSGSPNKNIPSDNFSAILERNMNFEGGEYHLVGEVDDQVRVYIDNKLVYEITGGGHRKVQKPLNITKGIHNVRVEYVELTGGAKLSLDFLKSEGWLVQYFNNTNFKGIPLFETTSSDISYNWGGGAPKKSISTDNFSIQFEGKKYFKGGKYKLVGTVDDLIKIYIDDKLVYDISRAGAHSFETILNVPEGYHNIKVQYTEFTGAANIGLAFISEDDWVAKYYNNSDYKGFPIYDSSNEVSFDWGKGSPNNNISPDYFSAIYEKEITFDGGSYNLVGEVDDLLEVYVGGKLLFKNSKAGHHLLNEQLHIPKGTHKVTVRYVEKTGNASLALNFVKPSDWVVKYYNNTSLKGVPVIDSSSDLLFDWNNNSLPASISDEQFSVSMEKDISFENGKYNIVGEATNPIKVYINDELIYEEKNSGYHKYSIPIDTTLGNHKVRVEYVGYTGDARLSLGFVKSTDWTVKYYQNADFLGTPLYDSSSSIYHDWGRSGPLVGINDNFSAEFEKEVEFESGEYYISGEVDDLVYIYINEELVYSIDSPGHHKFTDTIQVAEGTHNVRVKFVELTGGAKINLDFIKSEGWLAKYFSNTDFKGKALFESIPNLNLNWGSSSPNKNIPNNYFSAIFEKEMEFEGGDYFLFGESDDIINVYIDNKLVYKIGKPGNHKFTELIQVPKGVHDVRVEYVEYTGGAKINLNLVKSEGWLAKYYLNTDFTNLVFYESVPKLDMDWGGGSPDSSIPTNHYSAVFERDMTFEGGEYFLLGEVDDLVSLYIDNKQVFDIDKPGHHNFTEAVQIPKGTHKVRVEYVEYTGGSKIKLDFIKSNGWLAKFYSNTDFIGEPIITSVSKINYNWGSGSPDTNIPNNNFSATLERNLNFESGTYRLIGNVDDAVAIYFDNTLVYEITEPGSHVVDKYLTVIPGNHKVRVEYKEYTGAANLAIDFVKQQGVIKEYFYTPYNITFKELIDRQMTVDPQTDAPIVTTGYIREDALEFISSSKARVKDNGWRFRTGPGTDYEIVGVLNSGDVVDVLKKSTKPDNSNLYWYQIKTTSYVGWHTAERQSVEYYANPNNFSENSSQYLQFLALDETTGVSAEEINRSILNNTGILTGHADTFIQAANRYSVNEIYLISHALLETGRGESILSNGSIQVGKINDNKWVSFQPKGTFTAEFVYNSDKKKWEWIIKEEPNFDRSKATNIRKTYNMFGIGAVDSNPLTLGSIRAYRENWFSPTDAIIGGSQFIAEAYIHHPVYKQNTLYKMRWNPNSPATHQYASDIGWAVKQTRQMQDLYSLLYNYILRFDIPKYK